MKVTKEKTENSQAYLTIEMEPAEMEVGMADGYKHLVAKTAVPGFRKGKAPRTVLERFLGRGRMLEEAIDHLIPDAYEKALKDQSISAFSQPQLEITQAEPLIFKAVVPLRPTVELGDYKSIRAVPETIDIKEENIQSVIEQLRHQHGTWEPVERPVDYNDLAVIDIDATVEDKPYVKRAASQYQMLKDSITPAPGFVAQIVGLKKDEEKEFDITFPADYPGKEVAGKTGHFKVKLHEIKEEKLPEINDEFASSISAELKDVALLREEVVKSLKLRGEERARMDHEEKVILEAVNGSKIEYPPVVIEMEVARIINEQVRQVQMTGRGMDEYLKSINKTPEQLADELRPVAERNVKASLVLDQIAELEKIEVTESEIQNGINNMIKGTGEDRMEELRKLLDTPKNRENIRQSLLNRKTIEKLSEYAKTGSQSAEKPMEDSAKEKKEKEK